MPVTYFALLTTTGAAKLANAAAVGSPLKITRLAVGDGAGSVPTPDANRTALVNEVRRAPLNQLSIDPANSSQIVAEQIIPADAGGWWIREMGLYDESGALIAYANCAPSYKPLLAEGSGRTQTVRMVLIVGNTASVDLRFDASLVVATREYVDDAISTAINRLDYKQSVRAATTANITLSGLQTVDGIALAAGDRVLVKDQVAANENGIYVVSAGVWVRSADADESAEVTPALTVSVESGTSLADSVWQLITDAPISVGATSLVFRDITNGLARLASPVFTGTPTAPTPSQFDNSTKLATTEFIKRTGHTIAAVFDVTAAMMLTSAHVGGLLVVRSSVPITLTLPSLFSVPEGACIDIVDVGSTSGSIVATQGIDKLFLTPYGGIPSRALSPGDTLRLTKGTVGGSSYWILSSGSALLRNNGQFAALVNAQGYQKLPSGLIIQWGQAVASSTATVSIAYPIVFPSSVFAVTASAHGIIGQFPTPGNINAANFQLNAWDYTGARAANTCSWIAVGY